MRPYKKRWKSRTPNKTLVIVSEGKTEEIYFRNYRLRNSGLVVQLKRPNGKTDPESLVRFASHIKEGDDVWCVFDVDHHATKIIKKANAAAKKSGIKICVSNPCFELWYFLHFCYCTNKIEGHELLNKLDQKERLKGYEKTGDYFDVLRKKTQDAIDSSKRLNKWHEKRGVDLLSTDSNPSTQVFELVEHILRATSKGR